MMKRYLFFLCLACFFMQDCFSQSKEVAEAVKQINSIKSDSKYLFAESTTKDWEQAYEDAKSLLLVEIDNWVKKQSKKSEDVKGYVARIENNFMEVKTRRGNLYRVFVYIKKKNILTYNEDVDVTVNSLASPSETSSEEYENFESKTEMLEASDKKQLPNVVSEESTESDGPIMEETKETVSYVLNNDEEKFLALAESSDIQAYLKEHAVKFGKMSQMPKQQDCYVMLFSDETVEKHFKHIAAEEKDLELQLLKYENLEEYQGLGYHGIWFIMK